MKSDDLTVRVLIEIRDRLDQTNARLDQTNARLDQTNVDLKTGLADVAQRVDAVGDRVTGLELKLSTELHAVHATLTEVATVMKGRRELTRRVDRCEQDIAAIKRKLG